MRRARPVARSRAWSFLGLRLRLYDANASRPHCAVKTLLRPEQTRRALHVIAVSAVASREMALLVRLATLMEDWGACLAAASAVRAPTPESSPPLVMPRPSRADH